MNLPSVQTNPLEKALLQGDLSKLSEQDRIVYYKGVCESLGLNMLTKPFEYIQLNGKLTLYATKSCTEQLRSIHKISLTITSRDKFDDVYVVTARARNDAGREDEATGAVNVSGLKGDALANAFMKAETKAKRRVTLSICGLAMLDETEVETIPTAKHVTQLDAKPKTILQQAESGEIPTYVIPFGPQKGKTLEALYQEYGFERLEKYLKSIKSKDFKTLTEEEKVFILEAGVFLVSKKFVVEPHFDYDEPIPTEFAEKKTLETMTTMKSSTQSESSRHQTTKNISELDEALKEGPPVEVKPTVPDSKTSAGGSNPMPKKATKAQKQDLMNKATKSGLKVPDLSEMLKKDFDDSIYDLKETTYYKVINKFIGEQNVKI